MANEKRLIDANAMRDDWLENGENEYVYDTNAVLDSIDSQPTVDAVEVVRFRDCKFYELKCYPDGKKRMCCENNKAIWTDTPPDAFCSYGERKDGDGYGNCLVHPGADLRGDPDGGGIVHHCKR